MGAKLARVLKSLIKWLGFLAAYFADVPAFLQWVADRLASLIERAADEPIGATAIVCFIALAAVVGWLITKIKPPIL